MENGQKQSHINWFPGHMTKALREMEQNIKLVDLVIYVLDARAPYSCVNPKFTQVIKNKPILYVLNKADLADDNQTQKWQNFFQTKNSLCVILNSTHTNSTKIIQEKIKILLKDKLQKYNNKGVVMPSRAMVIGVPNCGKSTLINNLCGKYKATTGNKPGVTKGTQWVKVFGNIELLDTPGTLWPSFENQELAKNLAYIGSIKDEVLDISELALDFIEKMKKEYPLLFEQRYSIKFTNQTPVEVLEEVCKNRKFVIKGGETDWERGSFAILDDFRKGRLGKITLDKKENINKSSIN